uniref:Uncharacterized protein n=1 Tax=Glossina brevipalpis TaxID=37001 RepID=A0A1A9W4Y0_9MUSC
MSSAPHDSTECKLLRDSNSRNILNYATNETVGLESNISKPVSSATMRKEIRDLNETSRDVDVIMPNRPQTAQNSLHTAYNSNAVSEFNNFNRVSSFHESENNNYDGIDFSSEQFIPGELMISKFRLDEISWANKLTTIPRIGQAIRIREKFYNVSTSNNVDSTAAPNSSMSLVPKDSIEKHFGAGSNIPPTTKSKSSEKFLSSAALVGEQNKIVTNVNLTCLETDHIPQALRINSRKDKQHERNIKNLYELNNQEDEYLNNEMEIRKDGQNKHLLCISIILYMYIAGNREIKNSKGMANKTRRFIGRSKKLKSFVASCAISYEIGNEELYDNHELILKNKENLDSKIVLPADNVGVGDSVNFIDSESTMATQHHKNIDASQTFLPLRSNERSFNSLTTSRKSNSSVIGNKYTTSPLRNRAKRCALAPLNCHSSKSRIMNINASEFVISGRSDSSKNETCHRPPNDNCCKNLESPFNKATNCRSRSFYIGTNSCLLTGNLAQAVRTSSLSPFKTEKSDCSNATKARSHSYCSSSGEFICRDFKKAPLKVTKTELSWKSTKLRTNSRKKIIIKNTSIKSLVLRTEISGPGFQILNDQRIMLVLESQECRSIVVNFCPTVCGVAVGKLSFYTPTPNNIISHSSLLDIPLYGYGGHASIIFNDILSGPVGNSFIPMGRLSELGHSLERTINIYNKGTLKAFVVFSLSSPGLYMPYYEYKFEIEPKRSLIAANNSIQVRISFYPEREEIKQISKKDVKVLTLAKLRVIYGDEVSRQRIRRSIQLMSREERSKRFSEALEILWTSFPGETDKNELSMLKDNPNCATEMINEILRVDEILLTLNNDLFNETSSSSMYFTEVEDTVSFHTIYAIDTPNLSSTELD